MQCSRCGCKNKTTNEYCEACGSALGIECKACNHLNGPASRYCGRCGAALSRSAAAEINQSGQHVLQSLYAKGGERKRLTVLFADIRNSTGLMDSLGDPELGMKRLQPVLDLMNRAVVRYDGVVTKSDGAAVTVPYMPPHPHEDHPGPISVACLAMRNIIHCHDDPASQ